MPLATATPPADGTVGEPSPEPDAGPSEPPDHRRGRRRWQLAGVAVVYALGGLVAHWPAWPGDPARLPQCACADAGLNTWFLAWTAFALRHGLDPFVTTWINHPVGVNLAVNTQMPLLGLLAAPVTLTAGPVASLNLLTWLAFPLSATSMFFVLRRWTSWAPAAFAGGLLYGFSPYVAGQATAHLHLIFLPFPPLILLAGVELFVVRTGSARRWGLLLGAAATAQFFVSTEVLAACGLVALLGLVVLGVARTAEVAPALRHGAAGVGWALVVFVPLVAWPVALVLFGPLRYSTPLTVGAATPFRSDLLSPVVPTSSLRFAPGGLAGVGDRLSPLGIYSEDGAYLGVPLLALLAYLGIRFRSDRWIPFCLGLAGATFVLSLGSHLAVDGHQTGVPLPFALLQGVPLLDQMLPARLSLGTAFLVAVALALGLGHLRPTLRRPSAPGPGRRTGPAEAAVLGAVAVLALVSLIPRWPDTTVPTGTPSYFSSPAVDRIPPGSVALVYPYPMPGDNQAMVWQAGTGMRFRLLGGYDLIPNAAGTVTPYPSRLSPPSVEDFLVHEAGVPTFYETGPLPGTARLTDDLRQYLVRYDVGTVLVADDTYGAAAVEALVTGALGRGPEHRGGMAVWYDVAGSLSG